jgi:hypothetical protein
MDVSTMKKFALTLSALSLSLLLNAQQQQIPGLQPLATIHWSGSGGGFLGIDTGMTFTVSYSDFAGTSLFGNVVWTPGMVGQNLVDVSGSEPGYANFVSLLTDGSNERLGWMSGMTPSGGGAGINGWETNSFLTHPSGWNGIDLHGYTMAGVGLQMNQLSINSPGSNPNHDGNWTDVSWDATLTLYTVPEPTILFPVAVACVGFPLLRRHKLRRP